MMSGKDGVGQIIKAFVTVVTLIALTGRLRVIKAALDDLVGLTRWAGDTIWPAQLTDGLITLDIIDEMLDIDLHGGLLSEIVEGDCVSIHHPQIHDPGIQYERLPDFCGFPQHLHALPRRQRLCGRTRGPRGMLSPGEPGATLQGRPAGAVPRASAVGS